MKKVIPSVLLSLLLILGVSSQAYSWGHDAHRLIAQKAIQMLPEEMSPFFQANAEELLRLANVPDNEWKADPALKNRNSWHFLDIDLYGYGYPFKDFPRTREAVEALYAKGGKKGGLLPWALEDFYEKLTDAFRANDLNAIVENAGLISHFAADATMPLHSTRNYNGKYSGNLYYGELQWDNPDYVHKGVHQRFEIGLLKEFLEKYADAVDPTAADLEQIEDAKEHAFEVIVDSFWYKEHVLYYDKVIGRELGLTDDFTSFKQHQTDYYRMLDKHVGWLAVAQLRKGAVHLASLWYSAWQAAGKPTLPTH